MRPITPNKSSSRAGRFKKKLVSEAQLKIEAPVIEAKMSPFLAEYNRGLITDAELTSIYILTVLSHRHPTTWPGALRAPLQPLHQLKFPITRLSFEPQVMKRLERFTTIGEVFNHFALRSTPLPVNRALLAWSTGDYRLELMFSVPGPETVLRQQARGHRVVSVLAGNSTFILGERDPLSFTMHDLIHADHFYHDNQCYEGQLGFYALLNYSMERGHFAGLLEQSEFRREFEYLISDMNAYAIHMLKCLKAALSHYHPGSFERWRGQLPMSEQQCQALLELNHTSYRPELHDPILLDWLAGIRAGESSRHLP
jgi:hypothetical protein